MSNKPYKVALTYGTFDLFHIGHVQLIKRIRLMADRVIVGVSTDDFNLTKGKKTIIPFEHRSEIVANIVGVDLVIPESSWDQKELDIKKYDVDLFVIGDDWAGKFDYLSDLCVVKYLERTRDVSSTALKTALHGVDKEKLKQLKQFINAAVDIAGELVD